MSRDFFIVVVVTIALVSVAEAQVRPKGIRVSEEVMRSYRLKTVDPVYPAAALKNGVQGTVILQPWIDKAGTVGEVAVVSGDPLLVESAVAAVKQWKYKPYLLNAEPFEIQTKVSLNFKISKSNAGSGTVEDAPIKPSGGLDTGPRSAIRKGPDLSPRARVPSEVAQKLCVKKVRPTYPAGASGQGDVIVDVIIDEHGRVANQVVRRGDRVFYSEALDAVQKWRYKPYLLNGLPVRFETDVELHFSPPRGSTSAGCDR